MASLTGGRGPQMTGGPGYIRSGPVPYREPGSRKPEDALAVLLKAGANPNAKAPDGSTLLHQAVQTGNVAMVRALADAKVDFAQTNRDGLTALDVAEGKRPANAAARAGAAGTPPPAPAGRGRGGRGGASRVEIVNLLREHMGLPPAPPAPPAPAGPAARTPGATPDGATPDDPAATEEPASSEPADGEGDSQ
jgi:ankyrin repeat protein